MGPRKQELGYWSILKLSDDWMTGVPENEADWKILGPWNQYEKSGDFWRERWDMWSESRKDFDTRIGRQGLRNMGTSVSGNVDEWWADFGHAP
jgi:hypothetical protein